MENLKEKGTNAKLIFGLLLISLTFMMLIVTPPHAYADDSDNLPAVPVMPAATGKFPGYKPIKTTGVILPPSAGGGSRSPRTTTGWTNPYPKFLCSISDGGTPSGMATVAGGQVIEDWETGNLWFYNTATKSCSLIQTAPSGASNDGYDGLAAQGSLVALISFEAQGLWTCTLSTHHTCKSTSGFIPLSSSFCTSLPAHHCWPLGMAFDKNGNLWYADLDNGMEVELTKASHYSVVGNTRSDCVAGTGCMLSQIVIDSAGNHWVTDASCTGNLYENGQVKLSAGDALEGVAISTLNPSHQAHVYVAVTNFCGNYPFGFIGDTTDLYILPYPYSSGSLDAPGLTTLLYFSDWGNDKVWLTVDYA